MPNRQTLGHRLSVMTIRYLFPLYWLLPSVSFWRSWPVCHDSGCEWSHCKLWRQRNKKELNTLIITIWSILLTMVNWFPTDFQHSWASFLSFVSLPVIFPHNKIIEIQINISCAFIYLESSHVIRGTILHSVGSWSPCHPVGYFLHTNVFMKYLNGVTKPSLFH